jgi:hypothetical protein
LALFSVKAIMETLLADVRHSFRVLIKSPGFTIVAVLALALGIGANTAIFSVIDQLGRHGSGVHRVLLAPLPFPDSERIMRVQRKFPNGNGSSVSIPKFMAWRKSRTFQSMAAYDFGSVNLNLGTSDRPNPVNGMHVTANFFSVFGVTPFDLVCTQLDFFTCRMALSSLWFVPRRDFSVVGMLGCLHLSLLLIEETVVSWTGGAEWASRLGRLQL